MDAPAPPPSARAYLRTACAAELLLLSRLSARRQGLAASLHAQAQAHDALRREAVAAALPAATSAYHGRPLHGATSGALYVLAEAAAGFPPPRRDAFVSPTEAAALDPAVLAEARELLKRPAFPDRADLPAAACAGAAVQRRLAVAQQFDDDAAEEEILQRLHRASLAGLAAR